IVNYFESIAFFSENAAMIGFQITTQRFGTLNELVLKRTGDGVGPEGVWKGSLSFGIADYSSESHFLLNILDEGTYAFSETHDTGISEQHGEWVLGDTPGEIILVDVSGQAFLRAAYIGDYIGIVNRFGNQSPVFMR